MADRLDRGEDLEELRLVGGTAAEIGVHRGAELAGALAQQRLELVEEAAARGEIRGRGGIARHALRLEERAQGARGCTGVVQVQVRQPRSRLQRIKRSFESLARIPFDVTPPASRDAPHASTEDLRRSLQRLKLLRGTAHATPPRLAELKTWQSQRLERTYADLAALPRYRTATRFFLEDLYGPKDFSARDREMMRIVPVMARILPASAVETAALAIELDALSEELDQKLAERLAPGPITVASYARAYREATARPERERQVDLVDAVGHRLDALVKRPLVARMLKLMRKPAHLAGLADLQDFLERGFAAFHDMGGADEFLDALRARETAILNGLFAAAADPFSA